MKIGIAGYPVPPGVDRSAALEWTIREAKRLGVDYVGGDPRALLDPDTRHYDADQLRRLRDLADSTGVEIEPYVRGPFDLVGPDAAAARVATIESVRAARLLGGPYLRTGYGRLEVETSRFNPRVAVADHMARLVASLREAARIAADEGVVLAVENHCDFTGREIARVVEEVGAPGVRAALDTGNGLTVFGDPADDLRALAHLAVTTHLKDMRVVQHGDPGQVPFLPVGCALGEGLVDVPGTIRTLVADAPRGRQTPLIVETGWPPAAAPGEDGLEARRRMFAASIAYLRRLLPELGLA